MKNFNLLFLLVIVISIRLMSTLTILTFLLYLTSNLLKLRYISNYYGLPMSLRSRNFLDFFLEFIKDNLPLFILVFTDSTVSLFSAGYLFTKPKLCISYSCNLPSKSTSFFSKCFPTIEVLTFISSFFSNSFLIVSDSMPCIQMLVSNPFRSSFSPMILRIKIILFFLHCFNFIIKFLWVPSYLGILGKKITNYLAQSTYTISLPPSYNILFSDFLPILRQHVKFL